MASKDTKAPKVPHASDKPRQRKIYLSDEDWRVAKVYASKHDISYSEAFKIAIHKLASEEPHTSAPKPEQTVRELQRAVPQITEAPKAPYYEQ